VATYYKYLSVRDQLLLAKQNSKCDFEFRYPKNIKGLYIDAQWAAHCTDNCTPGFCEVCFFIFIPNNYIPQTGYLISRKKEPDAHVYFDPEVLKILEDMEILVPAKLQIDKNASKVLPSTLH
jgi:hypothetical protein